jgi:acyl-CoA thioester hydrolase
MYSTRIYYQDTDAGGVVYFANYLRFFEKSWFEYLLSIGISIPEWEKQDTYIIVRNVALDLVEKLKYGDMIRVDTAVKEIKNSYFILSHTVINNGKITTKGETRMVCINSAGKPKRIPDDFKNLLFASLQPEK